MNLRKTYLLEKIAVTRLMVLVYRLTLVFVGCYVLVHDWTVWYGWVAFVLGAMDLHYALRTSGVLSGRVVAFIERSREDPEAGKRLIEKMKQRKCERDAKHIAERIEERVGRHRAVQEARKKLADRIREREQEDD